jgi:hypothetical protein
VTALIVLLNAETLDELYFFYASIAANRSDASVLSKFIAPANAFGRKGLIHKHTPVSNAAKNFRIGNTAILSAFIVLADALIWASLVIEHL